MRTPLRLIKLSACIWSIFASLFIGQGSRPMLPTGWNKLQTLRQHFLIKNQSYAAWYSYVRHQQKANKLWYWVIIYDYSNGWKNMRLYISKEGVDIFYIRWLKPVKPFNSCCARITYLGQDPSTVAKRFKIYLVTQSLEESKINNL